MTAFEQAFAIIIKTEGGYSFNAADPGGETKFGISKRAHPDLDIAGLTVEQAQAIYKREYWDKVAGDALPPPLALIVFDAAVNSGVSRATKWLQAACGVTVDGMIGAVTLNAANVQGNGAAICAEFMAIRMLFMTSLPTWGIFGRGWSRRLARLPFQAMKMQVS